LTCLACVYSERGLGRGKNHVHRIERKRRGLGTGVPPSRPYSVAGKTRGGVRIINVFSAIRGPAAGGRAFSGILITGHSRLRASRAASGMAEGLTKPASPSHMSSSPGKGCLVTPGIFAIGMSKLTSIFCSPAAKATFLNVKRSRLGSDTTGLGEPVALKKAQKRATTALVAMGE